MLDEKDIQTITEIVDDRVTKIVDKIVDEKVPKIVDKIVDDKIRESEQRTLEQAARNMQVILENTVMKQLQLLAEGQRMILETLAPKTKTDELEDEIVFLKSSIRMHSEQLEEHQKQIDELKRKRA